MYSVGVEHGLRYFLVINGCLLEKLHSGTSFIFVLFLSLTYRNTYCHESEWAGIKPTCSGLPTLMSLAKPRLPTRLTGSTESLAINLVYLLQDERYTTDSWISCVYRVLSCKMCVKWSNIKWYQVFQIFKIWQKNTHSHALKSRVITC